jgi:hypothetical protein
MPGFSTGFDKMLRRSVRADQDVGVAVRWTIIAELVNTS